jgi:hypothetical protein
MQNFLAKAILPVFYFYCRITLQQKHINKKLLNKIVQHFLRNLSVLCDTGI